jgi:hypothetical protein
VLSAAVRLTGGDEEEATGKRCSVSPFAAPEGMKWKPLGR